jgi:peroxiredoxin
MSCLLFSRLQDKFICSGLLIFVLNQGAIKMLRHLVITAILGFTIMTSFDLSAHERGSIHATAEDAQPLLSGMEAPSFQVKDVHGDDVIFDPAAMDKPLILTFYRGGWCPFCNLHLSEMRLAEKELIEMGFDVWFISIDQPGVLAESLTVPDLTYTLLSDAKLEATTAFGIAFKMPDDLVERYLGWDIDVEAASGETHHVLPVPSTYIIGNDGVIRFQYTNTDYHVRLAPSVLMAAATAYKNDSDMRLRVKRAEQRAAEKKDK